MNDEKKIPFGLADITMQTENGEEIRFEARGGSIDIEPKTDGVKWGKTEWQTSAEINGEFEMLEKETSEFKKQIDAMMDKQSEAIDKFLSEIVADFGITEDDKKGARIETVIGAPAGDYSKVYVEGDLVAVYVPYGYPLKYKKFY